MSRPKPSANERALLAILRKMDWECAKDTHSRAAYLARHGVVAASAISGEYPLSGSEREAGSVTAADLRHWLRRVARDLE